MIYDFDTNEATASELLAYMKRVYGTQISGAPFTIYNLNNWIRIGKLPDAYGGNKIIGVQRYKELRNLLVLTIQDWNRVEVEALVSSVSHCDATKNYLNKQKTTVEIIKLRRQRTVLCHQILDKT